MLKEQIYALDKDCTNNEEYTKIVKDIVKENSCKIIKEQWQSKYNQYVIYDYKPFCSDGFTVTLWYSGMTTDVDFTQYLITKRIKELEHLKLCLAS